MGGFYTDPNHYEAGTLKGARMLSSGGSGDTFTLVGSDDKKVALYNVATGELRGDLERGGEVYTVALTSDGLTLAVGGDDKKVALYDAWTGDVRRELERRW